MIRALLCILDCFVSIIQNHNSVRINCEYENCLVQSNAFLLKNTIIDWCFIPIQQFFMNNRNNFIEEIILILLFLIIHIQKHIKLLCAFGCGSHKVFTELKSIFDKMIYIATKKHFLGECRTSSISLHLDSQGHKTPDLKDRPSFLRPNKPRDIPIFLDVNSERCERPLRLQPVPFTIY